MVRSVIRWSGRHSSRGLRFRWQSRMYGRWLVSISPRLFVTGCPLQNGLRVRRVWRKCAIVWDLWYVCEQEQTGYIIKAGIYHLQHIEHGIQAAVPPAAPLADLLGHTRQPLALPVSTHSSQNLIFALKVVRSTRQFVRQYACHYSESCIRTLTFSKLFSPSDCGWTDILAHLSGSLREVWRMAMSFLGFLDTVISGWGRWEILDCWRTRDIRTCKHVFGHEKAGWISSVRSRRAWAGFGGMH